MSLAELVASRTVAASASLVPRTVSSSTSSTRPGRTPLRAAELLEEMLEQLARRAAGSRARSCYAEQEGDRITHDIIQRLNSTFVTPIDREDIYGLATKLDDIVDYIEEAADFLGLYQIEAPMEQALALADVLVESLRAARDGARSTCAASRTSTSTGSRSTGSRTTATGSPATRSPRCSPTGSTRWS